MARTWLDDALLVDPEAPAPVRGSLLLEDGVIAACLAPGDPPPGGAERVALGGARVAPGLIDVHFHGALPAGTAHDAPGSLLRASASLARHGVTGFLATTVAWPAQELTARIDTLVAALDTGNWPGAVPIGVHLEGPWICDAAAGAQPPFGIRSYDPREGAALFDRAGSSLRLVTLAPEIEGARALETELARRGVRIALGHSLASADAVSASIANGAEHVTHLFNAMGCTRHRAPVDAVPIGGFAETVLDAPALGCDLIADGVHVHPDWLRVAARAKGDRAILISDRIEVAASDRSGWLGADRMRSDGVAWRLPDGRLAGSLLTLDAAIRNAEGWRVMSFHDAVAACTLRPARLLGIERMRGTLRPGARADLVVFDAEGAVAATWIAGRRVFPVS
jgi:N-acetylglucosamine-6-phosphate deacetylase